MKKILSNISVIVTISMITLSCKTVKYGNASSINNSTTKTITLQKNTKPKVFKNSPENQYFTGAENITAYLKILQDKNIAAVTNQTGIVQSLNSKKEGSNAKSVIDIKETNIIDLFLSQNLKIKTIFAPEHGFRGTADAGELIVDGKDLKTGLPIISLYGENKKPKAEHLVGIDYLVFDIQDVGARFYTFISSLHYIMESCAENNLTLIVLDRPNPNGSIIDGPILEPEFKSFVGMHPIPILHGMTIGEYAQMINGEKWLKDGAQCNLVVIPCVNYKRDMIYNLPIKPSPNLPNDLAINLYASLCLFEGTNVSSGRGTEKQFQIYGSPYLSPEKFNYSFTPKPNEGSKDPMHKNQLCYGEDLSPILKTSRLELKWLINAYKNTVDKSKFFNNFFTKLAGTTKLQEQIENDVTEELIRKSWKKDLDNFKELRKKYLIY